MITLILLAVIGVVDLAVLLRLLYNFKLLRTPTDLKTDVKDLPTISVCISARNETHAMTQCLERVVASDYPKLEVIVLDDGSRDDTSVLIKSFAHVGVRFVEGKPLPEGWLGKNYAQSLLANEASGKYIFFMDVDTLIERFTIARLVSYMQKHESKMVAVIPIRSDSWELSTLMTPMRYFWALLRFAPQRPRAVSNAWLVERQFLMDELSHDAALPLSMLMETSLAQKLAPDNAYRLVMSNTWLGVRYEKRWSSQVETSIRLLYPQCENNFMQVLWLILFLGLAFSPYVLVWWQPWALAVIALQYATAYMYLSHVWVRYRVFAALLLPVTLLQEVWLLVLSVYHYKRGTVTWKGRPVQNVHGLRMKKSGSVTS